MHDPPVWFFHLIVWMPVDADIISNAELWWVENSDQPLCNSKSGPECARFSCSSPISPLLSHPLSKDFGQTDICPFPLPAAVTSLSFSQAEYQQCDLHLSTRSYQTSRPDVVWLWRYLVEVTVARSLRQTLYTYSTCTNTDRCSMCVKSVLKRSMSVVYVVFDTNPLTGRK